MFVADGGSGKSTLMFALIRAGWHYLSDDVILLRLQDGEVQALPLSRNLRLHVSAARKHADIHARRSSFAVMHDAKLHLDLAQLYPERLSDGCFPRVLLYPRIVPAPDSTLTPLPAVNALWNLIRQSALIFAAPAMAHAHVHLLRRLVGQCKSYSLLAGRDLEQDPTMISRIVEDIP
jgi:hypothetical protein